MSESKTWEKMGVGEEGECQPPGGSYHLVTATVYRRGDRWRITVEDESGSNQGRLERHNGAEREYRADSLSDLMRVAIAETRSDPDIPAHWAAAAIRAAFHHRSLRQTINRGCGSKRRDNRRQNLVELGEDHAAGDGSVAAGVSQGRSLPQSAHRNDVPVAAWTRFQTLNRDNLHKAVKCDLNLYHANADLILNRTLEAMELLLGEELAEYLPDDKSEIVEFQAPRSPDAGNDH